MSIEDIQPGDLVRVTSIPDWLIHDLPEQERNLIIQCIGKETLLLQIDEYGYYWLGFGKSHENADSEQYEGHAFCVTRHDIEKVY